MHVREMRAREAYEQVLKESLTRGLTEYSGTSQQVSGVGHQRWWYQPLFGVYHGCQPSQPVRRWMRDSFRYTPVRRRALAQFLVGTTAASRSGLRLTQQGAFGLTPGLNHPADLVIIPGNQRIRLLCFRDGITRIWAKAGFDPSGLEREVKAREHHAGPFVEVRGHAADYSWVEEDLIEGQVLPRVAPWKNVRAPLASALQELDEWTASLPTHVGAGDYAQSLVVTALGLEARLVAKFHAYAGTDPQAIGSTRVFGNEAHLGSLATTACRLGTVRLGLTHGDLQPGNIMRRTTGDMVIIDWEHARERVWYYDRLVFGLRTRGGAAWTSACSAFLAGDRSFPFEPCPADRSWRQAALALFRLEEWVWYLREANSGPYIVLPNGLKQAAATLAWSPAP